MNRQPFTREIVDFYDVFVDWPSRLAREIPGVEARLKASGAHRVLDVGCGTGRHVAALLDRGYDAFGTDASPEMIVRAGKLVDRPNRFGKWRLEEPVPAALAEKAPFDAVLALGNVFPQLSATGAAEAALGHIHTLLRYGGVLLFGLKAFAVRRESGNPYLPLLRRTHEGRTLFFVRFLDFDADDPDLAHMHFAVLGEEDHPGGSLVAHQVAPIRVWSPDALVSAVCAAGFAEVAVSGSIGDREAPVDGEDVFVHARS